MDQNFVFNPGNLKDYKLQLQVGEISSPSGRTVVTLEGSGEFQAEQVFMINEKQERKEPVRVKGRIENAEEVFRQLERFDWQRKFPSRPGIPDEAIIVWKIEMLGKVIALIKMWLGEAEDDDRINDVLKRLRRVSAELSDNHIYI